MTQISAQNSKGYASPAGFAVDPIILTKKDDSLAVLLHYREDFPYNGKWGLPGGFVGEDESPEDTVERKVKEKTSLSSIYFEQLKTYGNPSRDPRGWIPSVAYLALVGDELLKKDVDAKVAWHKLEKLPELFSDHGLMIKDGVERIRGKLWYSNIARALLPEKFSLSEARSVYVTISGKEYDPGNFARDLKKSGLIKEAKGSREQGRGRPPALYQFVSKELAWSVKRR